MVIDLLILNLIVFIYFRRKGMSAEKSLKKGFKAMLIATPIKFALIFLLVPQYLPIYPEKRKLSETEVNMIGTAIWGYTIFYPVWGSYYYGMSTYRSKFKPDFYIDEDVSKYGELCEDSKWSDFEPCHKYIQNLGDLKKYESRFLVDAKKFLTKFPDRRCDSIHAIIGGLSNFSKESSGEKKQLAGAQGVSNFGERLASLYFGHFDDFFAPYEDQCHKIAHKKFYIYFHSKKGDYFDNDMNNYLQFVCEKYNSYCSRYWERFYSVSYDQNYAIANELHQELCEKWPKMRMCRTPRGQSIKEYNNMIEKIRESGDRSEKTSFNNLDTDKAY
ncbi:putative membrane protein [Halobacteriovorax marinus SJ]|uniref:Membrane protein n=2 Tax=Halobacteriovorax marinus TaxID=97084 RepID=E1WZM3_HALMS|nr:putative membrane protein [Halobacteriovorax marinus SJ]